MSSSAAEAPAAGANPNSSRKRAREGEEEGDDGQPARPQPPPRQRFGQIRVGQKRRRGVTGERNVMANGFLNIDVTSGSGNKVGGIKVTALSPMLLPVYDAEGKLVTVAFECLWQWSKSWAKAGHIQVLADGTRVPTAAWHAFRAKGLALKKGKRRPFPRAFGPADCAFIDGKEVGYVASRSQLYVPVYGGLIDKLPIMDELEKVVRSGQSVMIIDGDGPPRHLAPEGMDMTPSNWQRMLADPAFPFGHGYVVARKLAERCYPHLKF